MKGEVSFRDLLNKLRLIAFPIALQNLVSYTLNLVDTVMVGQLGEVSIAAVGIANQFFFMFAVSMFGFASGAAVLTAQYWGKGDKESVGRVYGLSMTIALVYSGLVAASVMIFPGQIAALFSEEAGVVAGAKSYLIYIAISYVFSALTTITIGVVRSVGKTVPPLLFSAAGIATNTFLNWCLIFGNLGFPKLGIPGAAIATVIARMVELTGILSYMLWLNRKQLGWKIRQVFHIKRDLVAKFIKYSMPVVINETMWSLGVTIQVAFLGRLGSQTLAAYNVVTNIERLSSIFGMGIANATAIIVGNEVGAGRRHHAYEYAHKLVASSVVIGMFFTGVLLLTFDLLMLPFKIEPETLALCRTFFYLLCGYSIFRNFNMPVAVGVFRGGGDPHRALLMDLVPMWCGSVPLVALGVFVFHLAPPFVLLLFFSDEIIKLVISIPGLFSKKWIRDVTI